MDYFLGVSVGVFSKGRNLVENRDVGKGLVVIRVSLINLDLGVQEGFAGSHQQRERCRDAVVAES